MSVLNVVVLGEDAAALVVAAQAFSGDRVWLCLTNVKAEELERGTVLDC